MRSPGFIAGLQINRLVTVYIKPTTGMLLTLNFF